MSNDRVFVILRSAATKDLARILRFAQNDNIGLVILRSIGLVILRSAGLVIPRSAVLVIPRSAATKDLAKDSSLRSE